MIAGVLLGLGASLCWAVANVAIQRSSRSIGSVRALLWAQVVGIALVAAVAPFVDERVGRFQVADGLWLLGAGITGLLAYVSLFHAFEHGKLTVVVPVMSSWSVIAAALSLVMFDDRVRPAQLAGAAAVVAGAIVVARAGQAEPGGAAPDPRSRWLLAAVGTAVGFGLLIPMLGRLAPVAGSVGAVGLAYVADIVVGLPLARARRVSLAPPPRQAWLAVALAGLFETGGFACIALGGRHAPLALVSPLAGLAPTFTVAYAWVVLRERPSAAVLAGAALTCAGVVVLAL